MIPRIIKVQTNIPCPAGAYRLGMETLARLIAQSVRQDQEKQRQIEGGDSHELQTIPRA